VLGLGSSARSLLVHVHVRAVLVPHLVGVRVRVSVRIGVGVRVRVRVRVGVGLGVRVGVGVWVGVGVGVRVRVRLVPHRVDPVVDDAPVVVGPLATSGQPRGSLTRGEVRPRHWRSRRRAGC